jgi:hypothetical protein
MHIKVWANRIQMCELNASKLIFIAALILVKTQVDAFSLIFNQLTYVANNVCT